MVELLFLAVPRGCLRFVIVVFSDHTHLLFLVGKGRKLVSPFHHTSNINDILMEKQVMLGEESPLMLIMDVVTRWNSTL